MPRTTIAEAQKASYELFKEITERRNQNEHKSMTWTPFALVTNLLEEAGEVASVVKGLEGYKPPDKPKTKEMLGVELSDLLYTVFALAETYGVDLEQSYQQTTCGYRTRFLKR